MLHLLETISDPAIRGCLESCGHLLAVVRALTPAQYRATWKGRKGIGPHMRHCVEHLTALRAGLQEGVICYDARGRDQHLEQDPKACATALVEVSGWIAALHLERLDEPLATCQIAQADAPPARSASSLRRELLFVTSHNIHHLAVIAMLAELQDIPLPPEIGLAHATRAYERDQQRRAQAPGAAAP